MQVNHSSQEKYEGYSTQPNILHVLLAELVVASRTLSAAIADSFIHALFTMHVPAAHDNALLVSVVTNRTREAIF